MHRGSTHSKGVWPRQHHSANEVLLHPPTDTRACDRTHERFVYRRSYHTGYENFDGGEIKPIKSFFSWVFMAPRCHNPDGCDNSDGCKHSHDCGTQAADHGTQTSAIKGPIHTRVPQQWCAAFPRTRRGHCWQLLHLLLFPVGAECRCRRRCCRPCARSGGPLVSVTRLHQVSVQSHAPASSIIHHPSSIVQPTKKKHEVKDRNVCGKLASKEQALVSALSHHSPLPASLSHTTSQSMVQPTVHLYRSEEPPCARGNSPPISFTRSRRHAAKNMQTAG